MTVSISPSNPSALTYGGGSIVFTMSGGSGEPLWSSDAGTFSNRFSTSATFTPTNTGGESKVLAQMVSRVNSGVTGLTALSSGRGYSKPSGSSWTASANSAGVITIGAGSGNTGFIEFESNENTAEKAAGLTISASYKDPTTVHETNSFILCWHLMSDGTAVPRKQGVPQAAPQPYSSGDIFRIDIVGNMATFKLRGTQIASVSVADTTALIGMASFKSAGATIDDMSFLSDTYASPANYAYVIVEVTGVFPLQPNYTLDRARDNITLFSYAEDGTFTSRVKGRTKRVFNAQFIARPFAEYEVLSAFWDKHQKHIPFLYVDEVDGKSFYAVHDGGLRDQVIGDDQITMSITIREI